MQMKWGAGIVAVALLTFGSSVWAASVVGSSDMGKKLYLESCQHCHNTAGDGKSEMGAYLTPPPADLTSGKTQSKADAELRKVIVEGRAGTAMTGYAMYDEQQLAHILAYIRSLKR